MITLQDIIILTKKIIVGIIAFIIPIAILAGGLYLIKEFINK